MALAVLVHRCTLESYVFSLDRRLILGEGVTGSQQVERTGRRVSGGGERRGIGIASSIAVWVSNPRGKLNVAMKGVTHIFWFLSVFTIMFILCYIQLSVQYGPKMYTL